MKIVFRPNYTRFDNLRFFEAIEKMEHTLYKAQSIDWAAPAFTDCITAVRWILWQSTDYILPHAYIWDIAGVLLLKENCTIFPISQAKEGDLIFFEQFSKTHNAYMINHIGIITSWIEFFHSSKKFNWSISNITNDIFYNHILSDSFLSIAKDPRNRKITNHS